MITGIDSARLGRWRREFTAGLSHHVVGEYQQALRRFEAALGTLGDSSADGPRLETLTYLADAAYRVGDQQEAMRSSDEAAAIAETHHDSVDPLDPETLNLLTIALLRRNACVKAAACARKAVNAALRSLPAEHQVTVGCLGNLGVALAGAGDSEGAVKWLSTAVKYLLDQPRPNVEQAALYACALADLHAELGHERETRTYRDAAEQLAQHVSEPIARFMGQEVYGG